MLHVSVLVQGTCSLQLESERQQEAEEASMGHNEMQEAHTRLKRLDKDLKQLTTHQVHATHAWCPSVGASKADLVYLLQLLHCQEAHETQPTAFASTAVGSPVLHCDTFWCVVVLP